jgi:heme-degrading monooxygenase HmoA
MVARHWRGWTTAQNANAYETLLQSKVLPGLRQIDGYRGGYVLRKDDTNEAEFLMVNLFDSLEAIKRFVGQDYTTPVFEPEATALLEPNRTSATHYEVRACPV